MWLLDSLPSWRPSELSDLEGECKENREAPVFMTVRTLRVRLWLLAQFGPPFPATVGYGGFTSHFQRCMAPGPFGAWAGRSMGVGPTAVLFFMTCFRPTHYIFPGSHSQIAKVVESLFSLAVFFLGNNGAHLQGREQHCPGPEEAGIPISLGLFI